jgi:threonine aldolase
MSEPILKRGFASDNNSGVHPAVMKELLRVNRGHVVGYGDDPFTETARELLRKELGEQTEVLFRLNRYRSNVLGRPESEFIELCHNGTNSHIETDECLSP